MGIKSVVLGRKCDACSDLGVNCVDPGILDLGGRHTRVYLDGNWVLRIRERIKDCSVLTGKNTSSEVVKKIRENVDYLDTHVDIRDHKIPNY